MPKTRIADGRSNDKPRAAKPDKKTAKPKKKHRDRDAADRQPGPVASGSAGRPSRPSAAFAAAATGRRIQVRRSGVHGKGVFAVAPIPAGDTIIEYVGEVISWKEALRRHPHDPEQPNHTFYFHIDDKHVIDANVGGNASRWINHACDTNCEADEDDGRIYIKALRNIEPGEELFYDYGLVIDEKLTKKLKKQYPCHCGSRNCRGTLLAPKRR